MQDIWSKLVWLSIVSFRTWVHNDSMYVWSIKEMELPLQFLWKISRGQSQSKQIFIIEVEFEEKKGQGEVAGITRTSDGASHLKKSFASFAEKSKQGIHPENLKSLEPHVRFGVTSAFEHLQCVLQGQTLYKRLGTNISLPIPTSFALPIMAIEEIGGFIEKYNLTRFPFLKIKVDANAPLEICNEVAKHFKGPLRVDANEAFSEARVTLDFLKNLSHLEIDFIEQPMPASQWNEYYKLKNDSPYPIIGDESLQSDDLDDRFQKAFHGINVKLMKAGSYQQALKQLRKAREWGLSTMLGCMVETTLGIGGALAVSEKVDYFDLDGFLYFAEEPFSHVVESNGHLSYGNGLPFRL